MAVCLTLPPGPRLPVGDCNVFSACKCHRNFMGGDCSQRVCGYGMSAVDAPAGDLNVSVERALTQRVQRTTNEEVRSDRVVVRRVRGTDWQRAVWLRVIFFHHHSGRTQGAKPSAARAWRW